MARSIIIDTDPGIDDTMAILFALRSPEVRVIGLTTVFGNHYVGVTTRNARRVLEMVGHGDIPVARGAETPLLRPYKGPPVHVHGQDGLGDGGVSGEPAFPPIPLPAAQFIVEQVMTHPGEITLVAIGPLTNIALALKLEPRIADAAHEIIVMGGTVLAPGNVSPVAEANVRNDPEAAALVFSAPWHLVMVGLDVTTATVMDAEYLAELETANNLYTDLISHIAPHYLKYHEEHYGVSGLHTHDPSAVAYAVDPTLFESINHPARIETQGYAAGEVIVDRLNKFYDGRPIEFCIQVDSPRLLALFRKNLLRPQKNVPRSL